MQRFTVYVLLLLSAQFRRMMALFFLVTTEHQTWAMDTYPVSASHGQDHDAIKRKWKGGGEKVQQQQTEWKKIRKKTRGWLLERRPAINRASGHIQSASWARNQAAVYPRHSPAPIVPFSFPTTLIPSILFYELLAFPFDQRRNSIGQRMLANTIDTSFFPFFCLLLPAVLSFVLLDRVVIVDLLLDPQWKKKENYTKNRMQDRERAEHIDQHVYNRPLQSLIPI